ncbi:MAG: histidinol-phosphate transaminase [Thaumarchaeota archaeon]|nr:histidinol-phosphate transaminase [Nitrososphaerota archaeon]
MQTVRLREFLGSFEPYKWEPSTEDLAKEVGKDVDDIIRFDTNTSPTLSVEWLKKLSTILESIRINDYPDTSYSRLRSSLAAYCDCDPGEVLVANGADEALLVACSAVIGEGFEAILSSPTYSYYQKLVEILGGRVVEVDRREDFSDDMDTITSSVGKDTRMIILCSPNNPTGNLVNRRRLEELLTMEIVVLIDEAYFEYCGDTSRDLIKSYDNLIIIRTMSKAFGLAGLRLGYALSSSTTITLLNKIRPPNSVGAIPQRLAEIALHDQKWMEKNVSHTMGEKERVSKAIAAIEGVESIPSHANFMLLRFSRITGAEAYSKLLNLGIVVRDISSVRRLEKYIRFSMGTSGQNNKFLDALIQVCSK